MVEIIVGENNKAMAVSRR